MCLGHSHLCSIGSYSTEQFTKRQSVLPISWLMETVFPSQVWRCSAFILSSFHTLTNGLFHRLPTSQTKGKEGGGFKREGKVFFPLCYSISFLLCTAPNGSFTSWRNLLHSYSPRKLVLCVCVTCVFAYGHASLYRRDRMEDVPRLHIIKFTTIKHET